MSCIAQETGKKLWVKMWYSNHNCWGIRNTKTGKQVGSLGGWRCQQTKEKLEVVADQVIELLKEDMSVADAIKWGKEYIAKSLEK